MHDPAMSLTRWIWLLMAVWAVLFAASFAMAFLTGPSGDGFTRGLNRIEIFAQLQFGAGAVGGLIWLIGRRLTRGSALRWISRIPVLMVALLIAVIGGIIAYAQISQPALTPLPALQPTDAIPVPPAE